MERPVVATLSTRGYLTDTRNKLAHLLANYILTVDNQSLIYADMLHSLPKTYYKYIHRPKAFAEAIRSDIEEMLAAEPMNYVIYEVTSDVTIDPKGYATVFLYASVVDDSGERVSMGNVSRIDQDNLGKILQIINGTHAEGVAYYREYIKI